MVRSSKKGPYIDHKLIAKIDAHEPKRRSTGGADLGAGMRRSSRRWSVTPSRCITAGSMFRSISPSTWLGHRLGEFAPTRTYRGHGKDADRRVRR